MKKWTEELIWKEARNFIGGQTEFRHSKVGKAAQRFGIFKDIIANCDNIKRKTISWTEDKIWNEAKNFKGSISEFSVSKIGIAAKRFNIYDEIVLKYKITSKYIKWTEEMVWREAKKFKGSRYEFSNSKVGNAARKFKIYDEVINNCKNIDIQCTRWTKEMILNETKKFKGTRTEYNKSKVGYAARTMGIYLEMTSLLNNKNIEWTEELIWNEAKKFKGTLSEFGLSKIGSAAKRFGIYKDVISKCNNIVEQVWTKEMILLESKNFEGSLTEFCLSNVGIAAKKLNIYEEVSKHLVSPSFKKLKEDFDQNNKSVEAMIPKLVNMYSLEEIMKKDLTKIVNITKLQEKIVKEDISNIFKLAKRKGLKEFKLFNSNQKSLNQKGFDYVITNKKCKVKIQYKFVKGRENSSPGLTKMFNDNKFNYKLDISKDFELFIDRIDTIISDLIKRIGKENMYDFILNENQIHKIALTNFKNKGKDVLDDILGKCYKEDYFFMRNDLNNLQEKTIHCSLFGRYSTRYFFQYISNYIEKEYIKKYGNINLIQYYENNIENIYSDYIQQMFHTKIDPNKFYEAVTHLDVCKDDEKIYILEKGKMFTKNVSKDSKFNNFIFEKIELKGQGMNLSIILDNGSEKYRFLTEYRNSSSKYSAVLNKFAVKDFELIS